MSLIPFAYSTQLKKLVSVKDVASGLSCSCLCPSCNMKLLDKATIDCRYSYWVSVRDMAKQILKATRYIKVKLNSVSKLQLFPYSSQSNIIEIFKIKKVQESDYLAITSIGEVKIYLSTPEHTKFSELIRSESFTDNLVLNINLSQYEDSKRSDLEILIINNIKCKTFLLPYYQLRGQEELESYENNILNTQIDKSTTTKLTITNENEILKELYLNRHNINRGTLNIIREMKSFYYESVSKCKHINPSINFKVIRSNGIINYISYKKKFFASTKIGIFYVVYMYHDDLFVRVVNTTNRDNICSIIDKHLNELREASLMF